MTSTVPSSESLESQRGPFEVVRDDDLAMTTRDGMVLRADAYRPEAPGPYPVLVRRTHVRIRKIEARLAVPADGKAGRARAYATPAERHGKASAEPTGRPRHRIGPAGWPGWPRRSVPRTKPDPWSRSATRPP